ncbi:2-oxoisovalerate dehydrogenase subunit beta [Abditibacteriota bacterium]|nr:2-oxoisovalerate dehydrogenase subunit beta [Abditibacteriota bacterium]
MATSREGDRREGILVRQGRGFLQVPGAGHEALAATCVPLLPGDWVFPYYRERAVALARGVSNAEIALNFFGKRDGLGAGRLMSSHFGSQKYGIFPSATPTGIQCLPSAGMAWGAQKAGSGSISVCFIGDASTRQGEFYEALCFALQEKLPVLFVVADNGYGISTPTAKMTPWNIGAMNPSICERVDGRDAIAVAEAAQSAIAALRVGDGPRLLWCELDRLWSHTLSDDHRVYRSLEEIEEMAARDPISLLRDRLIERGELTSAQWKEDLARIAEQVDTDYQDAERAPLASDATTNVLAPGKAKASSPNGVTRVRREETMVEALGAELRRALNDDPRVLMFGEDIEDPKGGVFGLTRGLSSDFPGRVVNSPLAEATIIGAGVGLAATGWKPVFEIQFIDFLAPAFNQLVNQAATLRWRSNGEFSCPLILLAPCGAYLPAGGPWHSQTGEGWWTHTPGLRVVVPSTPECAVELFRDALNADDPTLLLLPKRLFRRAAMPLSLHSETGALLRNTGKDATIVSWGNTVEISLEAADLLAREGIEVEVLDLRYLVPCDWASIETSLNKTGRLIVVQEDNATASFGATIITHVTSEMRLWDLLAAPPQLVTRPDVNVPFHPKLEESVLPDASRVADAVRLTMRHSLSL